MTTSQLFSIWCLFSFLSTLWFAYTIYETTNSTIHKSCRKRFGLLLGYAQLFGLFFYEVFMGFHLYHNTVAEGPPSFMLGSISCIYGTMFFNLADEFFLIIQANYRLYGYCDIWKMLYGPQSHYLTYACVFFNAIYFIATCVEIATTGYHASESPNEVVICIELPLYASAIATVAFIGYMALCALIFYVPLTRFQSGEILEIIDSYELKYILHLNGTIWPFTVFYTFGRLIYVAVQGGPTFALCLVLACDWLLHNMLMFVLLTSDEPRWWNSCLRKFVGATAVELPRTSDSNYLVESNSVESVKVNSDISNTLGTRAASDSNIIIPPYKKKIHNQVTRENTFVHVQKNNKTLSRSPSSSSSPIRPILFNTLPFPNWHLGRFAVRNLIIPRIDNVIVLLELADGTSVFMQLKLFVRHDCRRLRKRIVKNLERTVEESKARKFHDDSRIHVMTYNEWLAFRPYRHLYEMDVMQTIFE